MLEQLTCTTVPSNGHNDYVEFSHVLHAPKKSVFKTLFSKRELRMMLIGWGALPIVVVPI